MGDLDILYVNVPSGDNVIVDFIVFVEVFVIKGDFVVKTLIVEQDVPDEDFEFILLVFVGEFVDDAENLVDLVNDTDPLGVLELLIDLVFVPEEDDEAVEDADKE